MSSRLQRQRKLSKIMAEDILGFSERDEFYRSYSILYPKAGGAIVHVKYENCYLRRGRKVFT